ncbi:hypothetical protein BC941DRAFT_419774 [Chlamydoabsidia padenii]|nr:hypothetical protein BC941DRAFT_419774 [Chlamydoabsidia padenii]
MDGQITFKSEGSGFFSGLTRLPHQQVLQWAKEKDCCDARLVRLEALGTRSFPVSTGMVNLVEPTGISIISDIDDTIKETQILHGARTVLANTFFNPSKDIPGMAEAYMKWYTQGASFHYVSNSPFQLLSFLQDFLHTSHFPPGSMHLRLEGSLLARLIEIPGRAKRDAILKILQDFPHRHFVLVGDSGEIDLEIYTKIALEHPGRILKIFIHNVTTPYALHKAKKKSSQQTSEDSSSSLLGMASSSVLGLGRTKTLADLIIDPVPPAASQQCMQLYDRVQKARDQLSIDVVLFDSADTLRDDPVVQEALWQHWDSQTP